MDLKATCEWLAWMPEKIAWGKGKGKVILVSADLCHGEQVRRSTSKAFLQLFLQMVLFFFTRKADFFQVELTKCSWRKFSRAIILSKSTETLVGYKVSPANFAIIAANFFIELCDLQRKAKQEMNRKLLERIIDSMPINRMSNDK